MNDQITISAEEIAGAGIAETPLEHDSGERVRMIPAELIFPGELFARTEYDPNAFGFLCTSISRYGVVEPLVVVRCAFGYRVVSGDRRLCAAKRMGLRYLPCIVRKSADGALELSLKMSAKPLSPFDCAEAIRALGADGEGLLKRQEAEALSSLLAFSLKERIAAENAGLPKETLFELLRIKDRAKRAKLLEKTAKDRLSPREIRYLAKQRRRIRGKADIKLIANTAERLCRQFEEMGVGLDITAEKDRVVIKRRA